MKGMQAGLALMLGTIAPAPPIAAEVIRMNTPAPPLTVERVRQVIPANRQAAWIAYLDRSARQMKADRASLVAELKPGQAPPPPPLAVTPKDYNVPLDRPAAWYAGPEARTIAQGIVSFQTPAGGWSKNQDRSRPPRLPGQRYANDAETMDPDRSNFDAPEDRFWTFVGTLDNDATIQEMRFLTRVIQQYPGREGDRYRASFIKGVGYLLNAQFPNGGWPQNWPLEGGFHDGITFNDNAVAHAAMMLQDVGRDPVYRFVPQELRTRATQAVERTIDLILAAQFRVNGKRTGWPQQVDALTLEPISARNYEPRSIASGETTDILLFLMDRPNPSPAVRQAIEDGVAWLKAREIRDFAWKRLSEAEGRKLVPETGAGPLWSRNYDTVTQRPIFGDKNQTIHDDVNNISIGRRNGYNWYVTQPQQALERFTQWKSLAVE